MARFAERADLFIRRRHKPIRPDRNWRYEDGCILRLIGIHDPFEYLCAVESQPAVGMQDVFDVVQAVRKPQHPAIRRYRRTPWLESACYTTPGIVIESLSAGGRAGPGGPLRCRSSIEETRKRDATGETTEAISKRGRHQ